MNNIDHITPISSILKVTASASIDIEKDLQKEQTESITTILKNIANNEQKTQKNNI